MCQRGERTDAAGCSRVSQIRHHPISPPRGSAHETLAKQHRVNSGFSGRCGPHLMQGDFLSFLLHYLKSLEIRGWIKKKNGEEEWWVNTEETQLESQQMCIFCQGCPLVHRSKWGRFSHRGPREQIRGRPNPRVQFIWFVWTQLFCVLGHVLKTVPRLVLKRWAIVCSTSKQGSGWIFIPLLVDGRKMVATPSRFWRLGSWKENYYIAKSGLGVIIKRQPFGEALFSVLLREKYVLLSLLSAQFKLYFRHTTGP